MISNTEMVIVISFFLLVYAFITDVIVAFVLIRFSKSELDRDTFIRFNSANPGRWLAYKILKEPYPKFKNKKNH